MCEIELNVVLSWKVRTWSGSSHFRSESQAFDRLIVERRATHVFQLCIQERIRMYIAIWLKVWLHFKMLKMFLIFLYTFLSILVKLFYLCPVTSKLVLILTGYLMDIVSGKGRHLSWAALIVSWMDGWTPSVFCF